MNWFEVKVKTKSEAVEAVVYALDEVGIEGVMILDPNDPIYQKDYQGDWDYIDESVRTFDFEDAFLTGYIVDSIDIDELVRKINARLEVIKNAGLDVGAGEVTYTRVNDEDWANEWKKYYKPLKISEHIVIKPTWEEYEPVGNEKIIEIDPGSAFGSGTHETTALCLKMIEKYFSVGDDVFDIGCGTGILGIAAAKLGANKVVGIDLSENAIIASKENAEINKVEDVATFLKGDLTSVLTGKADMVIANIMADIIILLSENVADFMKEDGVFVASGIILDKVEEVQAALDKNGFEIIETQIDGEWSAIVSKHKK